ncbi:hypothetical protein OROGR_029755 [Orobanche gracilis]
MFSLCNTKTTSKQTLLLHADGKKHRAKARAFHSSKQQPNNDTAHTKGSDEKYAKDEVPGNKDAGNQNSIEAAPLSDGSGCSRVSPRNQTRKENSRHLRTVTIQEMIFLQNLARVKLEDRKRKKARRGPNTVPHRKMQKWILLMAKIVRRRKYSGKS